jgi:hypothetical protein
MKGTGGARAAIAIGWGLAVSVAAYAVARAAQAIASPPLDPARIAPSAHVPFFWRALTSGYAGGIGSFVAAVLALRHENALARALGPAVVAAAALLAIEVLFWP